MLRIIVEALSLVIGVVVALRYDLVAGGVADWIVRPMLMLLLKMMILLLLMLLLKIMIALLVMVRWRLLEIQLLSPSRILV